MKTNELTHFSTNNAEEYPEEDYHLDVEDDLKDLVGDDVSLNTIFCIRCVRPPDCCCSYTA